MKSQDIRPANEQDIRPANAPEPSSSPLDAEARTIINISKRQKEAGRKIVAVQGLGFVGSIMAAIIADATNSTGDPLYFVHAVNRPTESGLHKIETINKGVPPIVSSDPKVPDLYERTIHRKKTLRATCSDYAYKVSDVVVVDVQLHVFKPMLANAQQGECDMESFVQAIRTIGHNIQPETLVLIETTVPPGTCELVIKPTLEEEFAVRGIDTSQFPPRIGHSYERVMPGPHYVDSIKSFWRTYSGIDETSKALTREFLTSVIDVDQFPLFCLDTTTASEIGKTLENSFRATNIALIYEWTLFAEDVGVNLFEVVDSIRVRDTHRNIMYPGFGVGGYCLTKDAIVANWASTHLFGRTQQLEMSLDALNINARMPLHTLSLIEDALRGEIAGKKILILGVSYLHDVADTRDSPTETLYKALRDKGAILYVHDPLVVHWNELPEVDISKDLHASLKLMDAIIFAVQYPIYQRLEPELVVALSEKKPLIVDAWNLLNDDKIRRYLRLGCDVRGVGKGHIKKLKEQMQQQRDE